MEVKIPDIGTDEVEVIEILVKLDQKIELEQGLIIVEGDKASIEIPSSFSGTVKKIIVKVGDKVQTSSVIMILSVDTIYNAKKKDNINLFNKKSMLLHENKTIQKNNNIFSKRHAIHATPSVRRLARKLNIDLINIVGSGRKSRILQSDIELYQNKNFNDIKVDSLKKQKVIHFDESKFKEININSIQKITGINLSKNWSNIPHVTQFNEFDITSLDKFRQKYNHEKKNIENNEYNITILVFIIKIISYALEKFPLFNSSLSLNRKKIILKKYINIGIAVEVKNGLVVPVLKDTNKKNIQEISSDLILISKKARDGKLNLSDMKDSTFTISNLGGISGGWFSPIINSSEVAILGVSRSVIKPFWNGNKFVPSLMLPLSLSYDHRVINGADAARFIVFVGKLLSDIRFLIM